MKRKNTPIPYMPADNTRVAWNPQLQSTIIAKEPTPSEVDVTDNPLGYFPVAGDILQGAQAAIDFSNGDWKRGLLNSALLVVPNVLEKPIKNLSKVVRNTANTYVSKKPMKGAYKRNNKVDLNQVQDELEDAGIIFRQNYQPYDDPVKLYGSEESRALDNWARDYTKDQKSVYRSKKALDMDITRDTPIKYDDNKFSRPIIWDNYVNAMDRRRHDYFFGGIQMGDYPPYVYYDKSSSRPSALFGAIHEDSGIFMPSHFAPSNLRSGLKMVENLLNEPRPVVFAVPDDLSKQLSKIGYIKLGQMPQRFGNEYVMKDIMVNRNLSVDKLPINPKYIDAPTFEKNGKLYFSENPVLDYDDNFLILEKHGGKLNK